MRNAVRFDNDDYVRSHMREPRGTGSWAFRFDNDNEDWFAPSNLSFVEARAAARREAAARGATLARVQP